VRSTMMDTPLTIAAIMRYGTTTFPDSVVATATPEGSRSRTYAEVGARAAQLANALRRLGVDGDQRVATFMWNNAEHLEAYLAVPSMGAVLHTLNIRLSAEQLAFIANHAADDVIIADASLAPLLAAVLPAMETVRHVIVADPSAQTAAAAADQLAGAGRPVHLYEDLLAAEPESFDWPVLDERDAAAMCYTSGTTGNPKGVLYSHRSAYLHSMAVCTGNAFAVAAADRVLPVVPMFHANAWGLPYAAVMAGADLVMPDRFLQPAPLARLIADERVTIAGGVPTIFNELLRYMRANGGDLSSLRAVPCGGSAVPHSLIEAFEKEFGVRVVHAWGMTEISPVGSVAHPPPGTSGAEAWRYRDCQGRLLALVEGRLVGDGEKVLPHDGSTVGEIQVRGPWVTGSYYRDEDPDKFDDGWLRTGDVGTIDRLGYITLTDRAKDVIKSGGEWISSVELENALMAHPDVVEAAVIGVPDDKWGERPFAAVVIQEGSSVGPDELREFLSSKVARWQLPERWSFVAEVPKTSVGKFAKTRMRDNYAKGDYEVVERGRDG
jgi:acyl-CoA synthetase (AMP-forming)/AMP-acid ligase II